VTISPSWFDPAETPAQITPFGILYALHDAVSSAARGAHAQHSRLLDRKPDGRVYEFTLRQGCGSTTVIPVPEDVQYSFTRYKGAGPRNYRQKSPGRSGGSADRRFHLREPWPDFMTFYGTTATAAGIVVPKKYLEQVGADGFQKAPWAWGL